MMNQINDLKDKLNNLKFEFNEAAKAFNADMDTILVRADSLSNHAKQSGESLERLIQACQATTLTEAIKKAQDAFGIMAPPVPASSTVTAVGRDLNELDRVKFYCDEANVDQFSPHGLAFTYNFPIYFSVTRSRGLVQRVEVFSIINGDVRPVDEIDTWGWKDIPAHTTPQTVFNALTPAVREKVDKVIKSVALDGPPFAKPQDRKNNVPEAVKDASNVYEFPPMAIVQQVNRVTLKFYQVARPTVRKNYVVIMFGQQPEKRGDLESAGCYVVYRSGLIRSSGIANPRKGWRELSGRDLHDAFPWFRDPSHVGTTVRCLLAMGMQPHADFGVRYTLDELNWSL